MLWPLTLICTIVLLSILYSFYFPPFSLSRSLHQYSNERISQPFMIPACGHQFCEGCGTEALAEKGYCPDCEVPCYARELKPDPAVRYLFPAHSFLFCFSTSSSTSSFCLCLCLFFFRTHPSPSAKLTNITTSAAAAAFRLRLP